MLASIKSEFRKLLSIRSTYIISFLCLVFAVGLFGFWGSGLSAGDSGTQTDYMSSIILNSAFFASMFVAIIALLAVTHEYRYNIVTYTLTSSNSRTKSLIAKMLVIFVMTVALTTVVTILAPLAARLGMSVKGLEIVPQSIDYFNLTWRSLFFGSASALFAAILAMLIRNQVGAIITYFIVISMVEEMIGGFILKQNAKWLPFTSLQHVINPTNPEIAEQMASSQGYWRPEQAALLFTGYLVILGIVTWLIFMRRDAN